MRVAIFSAFLRISRSRRRSASSPGFRRAASISRAWKETKSSRCSLSFSRASSSAFSWTRRRSSWAARLGYLLCRPALEKLRIRLDPRRYNGAILLGLNGIVVKSHGGTDAIGFANAIGVAVDMVANDYSTTIKDELERLGGDQELGARAAAV